MIANKPEISAVVQNEGIVLTLRGQMFWGLCPFHPEKTPSFAIDTERQRGRCFGCGWSGDVIDYVRQRHSLSFKEASRYLGLNSDRPEPAKIAETQKRKELIEGFRIWERDTINGIAEALRFYRKAEAAGFDYETACVLGRDFFTDAAWLENAYEILCAKDDAEKFEIFVQEHAL